MGGIVGKLTQGAADAGFVYITDVKAAGGALKAIELPADVQPQVAYGVAVVKGAKHAEQAQAFVDGLLKGDGADQLREAGLRTAALVDPCEARRVRGGAGRGPRRGARVPHAARARDLRGRRPGGAPVRPGRPGGGRRAAPQPRVHARRAGDHHRGRDARRVVPRHARVPRQERGRDAGRAAAGAAAGGRRHRPAGGTGAERAAGRRGAGPRADHRGCHRGARVRLRPLPHAPGAVRVRGGGPLLARRVAHARRDGGARRSCASRSRPRGPGWSPGWHSRGAARSASSGRR